jgi:integrase
MIISNASLKLATAISISKDTGLRPIEVMNLTLRDLDLQNSTIYPTTAKHGSPRALKLKTATVNILNKYLMSRNMGLNDKLFGKWNSDTYGKWFRHTRNKVSNKMADITIKSIRLYDLRHFYATMTYHRTKDILYLKQQMGHKRIATTLLYTQLLNLNEDEWTCKGATTVEQATQLIENGFQYVTEMDGVKLFRKRK